MSCLSLGLPLGVAVILTAIVQTTISCQTIITVARGIKTHWDSHQWDLYETRAYLTIIRDATSFLRVCTDFICLWFGTILRGICVALVSWIVVILLNSMIFVISYIQNVVSSISRDEFNIDILIIVDIALFVYTFYIALQCLSHLSGHHLGEIRPVARGLRFIWSYFANKVANAARLLLLCDIILSVCFQQENILPIFYDYLSGVLIPVYLGGIVYQFEPIRMAFYCEEYVIRFARIVLAVTGKALIHNDLNKWMKHWCVSYTISLIVSIASLVYLMLTLMNSHEGIFHIYFTIFLVSIFFRLLVLIVCILLHTSFIPT